MSIYLDYNATALVRPEAIEAVAKALAASLASDAFSPIRYEAQKPKELLDEDQRIGALKLAIPPQAITITPVDEVFAK